MRKRPPQMGTMTTGSGCDAPKAHLSLTDWHQSRWTTSTKYSLVKGRCFTTTNSKRTLSFTCGSVPICRPKTVTSTFKTPVSNNQWWKSDLPTSPWLVFFFYNVFIFIYIYICFNGNDLEMASKMHWASGKIIVFHQCKTCTLLNRPLKKNNNLFLLISKTFVQMSHRSHDQTQVTRLQNKWDRWK